MATDKSLATLLRALQIPTGEQDISRLLGSASTLLTLLSNPLNVTLLTSHILTAPAIWQNPDGLRTSFQILGVFNSASLQMLQHETDTFQPELPEFRRFFSREDWVKAVVNGANAKSPRWKHLLVLGGLLTGFESQERRGLSAALRRSMEGAAVKAANLAMQEVNAADQLGSSTICMVFGHLLDLLSNFERGQIEHDRLLPLLIQNLFLSKAGLHWGYFLGPIDMDVVQVTKNTFEWSPRSSTYVQLQRIASGPLIASFGSLSRLVSLCVDSGGDVDTLFKSMEDLAAFTRSLTVQWRQTKLSEVDLVEESVFLSDVTIKSTLPLLWRVLKSTMFAIVTIQRAFLGRVLGDGRIPATQAPFAAIQNLHILRDIQFISCRLGKDSLSQHVFVHLTAIDILSKYPVQAEAFLRDIRPTELGRIPEHPAERSQDLFFLDTSEHFTLTLPPQICETLLLDAALPYLGTGSDSRLLELFETAHSVVLAIFSAPQNYSIVVKHLPMYLNSLFGAFPQNLSPRQFRFAIKTLVRITSPPSYISEQQPLLSSTILELVHERGRGAPTEPLPPLPNGATKVNGPQLSQQAVLLLALIDSLPVLPIDLLEEWLPLIAEATSVIEQHDLRHECRQRFWEVLISGEMDVARAAVCVTWWNMRGGRELLLRERLESEGGPFMSGALAEVSKL